MQQATAATRVLAILVVHNGAPWLPEVLTALKAQSYGRLDVVAVDNGSRDGSRQLLIDALGEERVLVAERDLGFGAAVAMAADTERARRADHLLFLHDDLCLAPDAVAALVAQLDADPRLSIVGCKLLDWDAPDRLQAVGMSVDLTGRPDSDLEPDERDQGQRDRAHPSLYVSTGGMMVRRDRFESLGRFDRRYHIFRDDLDLCWRAWVAGDEVEVAPAAVGRHVASASNYERLGQAAHLGPRYFAERNTLATLLKNYGSLRLLLVLPLFFAVGVAKVLGFVATRRLSDAWQTVRAWVWNLLHLRETLRLRGRVQGMRQRSDGELRHLFARVAPRMRAYAEEVAFWLTGGDVEQVEVRPDIDESAPKGVLARGAAWFRARPVTISAVVLSVFGLVVAIPLLGSGSLSGGDLSAWPDSARDFLAPYGSSWHDVGGIATAEPPSPAQAVLGLLTFVGFGSAWLTPRLIVLGALPLAWILALRAGAIVTPLRLPRLAAATLYVLSPPALAAVGRGNLGAMAAVVLLPALAITLPSAVRPGNAASNAWRGTAASAILLAVLIAFEPTMVLLTLAVTALALIGILFMDVSAAERRGQVLRILAASGGALILLIPWTPVLISDASPIFMPDGPIESVARPFWQWLVLAPELPGFPAPIAGIGYLAAGGLGLVFGFRRRPVAVALLWTLALAGVFSAWALGQMGEDAWVWPGLPLLLAAGGLAGLAAIAFAVAGRELTQHDFGWRQLATSATAVAVVAGFVLSGLVLLGDPWGAYTTGTQPLPAFLASDVAEVGAYRVLVMADHEGVVQWDVTGAEGPTMARFGTRPAPAFVDYLNTTVRSVMGGSDPGAAGRLGLANIRYVVVPEGGRTAALDQALADQFGLEPQPTLTNQVFRVSGWLPAAAFVPEADVAAIDRHDELPPSSTAQGMTVASDDRYLGLAPVAGAIMLAESGQDGWRATADGQRLAVAAGTDMLRFEVPQAAQRLTLQHSRQGQRTALVLVQVFALLIALSLMLRPPRFAETRQRR